MSKTYFGFGLADGMFPPDSLLSRRNLSQDEVIQLIDTTDDFIIASSPSDEALIASLSDRSTFVHIRDMSTVKLEPGDKLIVLDSRLPLSGCRPKYTKAEIEAAKLSFGLWYIFDFSQLPPYLEPDVAYGFDGE